MRSTRPADYVVDPDPLEAAFVEFGQPCLQQLADRLAPLSAEFALLGGNAAAE